MYFLDEDKLKDSSKKSEEWHEIFFWQSLMKKQQELKEFEKLQAKGKQNG